MTEPDHGANHADQLSQGRCRGHGQSTIRVLQMVNADVANAHRGHENEKRPNDIGVALNEIQAMLKLIVIATDQEREEPLVSVHVEHEMVGRRLVELHNLVLIRPIDTITNQGAQNQSQTDAKLPVERKLARLLGAQEGEHHDTGAHESHAELLGQGMGRLCQDNLAKHDWNRLAGFAQNLKRENNVLQGREAKLVGSEIAESNDEPLLHRDVPGQTSARTVPVGAEEHSAR
mmetsp:Transcript_27678/g.63743  ORF Transcript_27678/g.63743 Transcript_27678/m.63743 type:complete len:232 (+) Transcript_27678:201-896(+)